MTTSDETTCIGGLPGDFCHDNFEHPLLWCDDKKRLIERKNAEDSMRMWRRRKAEEVARKEKEKQEYDELFLKHCPWGRPGGGAPNIDVRRKDITAVGLHSTPTLASQHRLSSLQPCPRFTDYFTQHKKCYNPVAAYHHSHPHSHQHHHHHTVARMPAHGHTHSHTVHHDLSDSRPVAGSTVTICERGISGPRGKVAGGGGTGSTQANGKIGETLEITLKDHPSMSFRNKGHLDIEVRYKPTALGKGRPLLEKIVVTENEKCPAAVTSTPTTTTSKSPVKKKFLEKMEKPPCKEPWGKSGPGGKPWRDPKTVGSCLMKSLGWTNKEMLKELDQDNPATPAEKHTFRKVRNNKKPQMRRCCDMCTCSCPALLNSAGVVGGGGIGGCSSSPLKPIIQKRTAMQQNNSPHKREIPTKIDAGKQKICPRLLRCGGANIPHSHAHAHAHRSQQSHQPQTTTDNSTNSTMATTVDNNGGVELVPLLARRRANNRPISLSSTDVTKRTASHDRIQTAEDLRYLHDLNEQISSKRRSISTAHQLDVDLCNRHFETFDTYWGRPGHGAPGPIKQKLKLNNLLYGDQGQDGLE